MVNTSGLLNSTRNRETCFEIGFTVSDFTYKIDRSVAANPTSNLTFGFQIDHALRLQISYEEMNKGFVYAQFT